MLLSFRLVMHIALLMTPTHPSAPSGLPHRAENRYPLFSTMF
jgi:hypothetical protein